MTLNQAKEHLQNADANDPAHQRVLQAMQKRNMTKYNTEASRFKAPDVSEVNFTKDDLKKSYASDKAKTEVKIANTENEIATRKQRIRDANSARELEFKVKAVEVSNKILEDKREITDTKEQIKSAIDKRAKEGTLKVVGKVVIGKNNYDKKPNKK